MKGVTMLGWSIQIKHGDKDLLFAESIDIGLDHEIRERADEVLDSNYYAAWGYGYPNRYHIRNDQLPQVEVYRYIKSPDGCSPPSIRETFTLGPFLNIPDDAVLWVELWDQS